MILKTIRYSIVNGAYRDWSDVKIGNLEDYDIALENSKLDDFNFIKPNEMKSIKGKNKFYIDPKSGVNKKELKKFLQNKGYIYTNRFLDANFIIFSKEKFNTAKETLLEDFIRVDYEDTSHYHVSSMWFKKNCLSINSWSMSSFRQFNCNALITNNPLGENVMYDSHSKGNVELISHYTKITSKLREKELPTFISDEEFRDLLLDEGTHKVLNKEDALKIRKLLTSKEVSLIKMGYKLMQNYYIKDFYIACIIASSVAEAQIKLSTDDKSKEFLKNSFKPFNIKITGWDKGKMYILPKLLEIALKDYSDNKELKEFLELEMRSFFNNAIKMVLKNDQVKIGNFEINF